MGRWPRQSKQSLRSAWLISEKARSMRACATTLGLLLACSALDAQEPPPPPDMLRFLLVLPEDIPPDGVQIQYFSSWSRSRGSWRALLAAFGRTEQAI